MRILAEIIKKISKNNLLDPLLSHTNSQIGKNVKFGDLHYFEINKSASCIKIGNNVKFYPQVNLTIGKNATLTIGENTTINKYTSIVSLNLIQIGDNCLIGENVKIYDNNHRIDIVDGINFPNHKEFIKDPIIIGNNVWLASGVTILKGVTIGDNCVIGAGCVIHKDVPANSIVINKQEQIIKNNFPK